MKEASRPEGGELMMDGIVNSDWRTKDNIMMLLPSAAEAS